MPDESLNHRRHPRVPVAVPVRISTIDPETDPSTGKPYFRTSEETCANVSSGGTFVQTRDPIAPGRRLLLELDIPGGPRIQTIGRVAWTRAILEPAGESANSGFGIEFTGGSPEYLSEIQAFLERNEKSDPNASDKDGWKPPTPARRRGA